jgi:trimethylamine--corrinoid protein Co-methyltransferase
MGDPMISETPPLQPIVPAYQVNILSDDQLDQLQSATLEILEQVGIHCPSEKALKIYAEHGGLVDFSHKLVKLPPTVVLSEMSHAPRFYTMGARQTSFDLRLDGKALYCATDGCGVETIDFVTGQRRPSKKADVADMARVSDALSAIGFYWPIVSAQDFPETAPLHELEASFNNTIKHVQSETIMGEWTAQYAIEMADVIAGNEQARRQRPPLSLLVCSIAPLAQDRDGLESALMFAQAGLPVGFMSMANTGSTAPATLAGTLVTADAEIISALVLIQMACPGAPVFHSMMPGIMHPRTGDYLSSTLESSSFYPLGTEIAHHWRVPTLAGVFGTDAMVPGWQSAAEAESSLLLCALTGAETGSGLGLVESCMLLYPEAVVMDADVYHRVRHEAAGLDTSPEALALEVIKEVGPRGHFLANRHTRMFMRQRQFSPLTSQPNPGGGIRDPREVAKEKVKWILAHHHPLPLDEAQKNELARILKAADREKGQEEK